MINAEYLYDLLCYFEYTKFSKFAKFKISVQLSNIEFRDISYKWQLDRSDQRHFHFNNKIRNLKYALTGRNKSIHLVVFSKRNW